MGDRFVEQYRNLRCRISALFQTRIHTASRVVTGMAAVPREPNGDYEFVNALGDMPDLRGIPVCQLKQAIRSG